VVFTVPPEPAPCAPTALKPLFMACDHWRRAGVLADIDVRLVLPEASATGLAVADERIEHVLESYGVEVLRQARIQEVDPDGRAITVSTPTGPRVLADLDFAHAVPHYRAPRWIADSDLAVDAAPGLVDIDPGTLRHRRHGSIWALGDAANLKTRSSGGALREQVKILSANVAAARDGGKLQEYDGYTVMPITVSRRRLMLAEVDREGRQTSSARWLDLSRPRRALWFFDRYVLPSLYWHRILRGKV
jgi:sulfide:quinone oxidoreductase